MLNRIINHLHRGEGLWEVLDRPWLEEVEERDPEGSRSSEWGPPQERATRHTLARFLSKLEGL